MIYTNNIKEFAKNLENKLNETVGSKSVKVFKVEIIEHGYKDYRQETDGLIYIHVYWCLSINELIKIQTKCLDNFIVSSNTNNEYRLLLWTTYKEGE